MASSYIECHSHEELYALVTNLVEGVDLLTEASSIVAVSGLSHDHLNTTVPISTVWRERERGKEREREGESEWVGRERGGKRVGRVGERGRESG